MKEMLRKFMPLADVVLMPLVYPAAWLLKNIRRAGVQRLPLCRRALVGVGAFPIVNHYYEPQFDNRDPAPDFSSDRVLPGIDWNVVGQLELLEKFTYSQELADVPQDASEAGVFYMNNSAFGSGDAEYWFQIIRTLKPRRIYEIGSGNSTLMAIRAIEQNRKNDPQHVCEHVCIEPYEMPWLERVGVTVIRKKVEDLPVSFFSNLQQNDILFIDSSHVIRPQGDVLFEFLELLPSLNKGVIVHVHDIFSPKNYPKEWLQDEVRFWNEQYLLEAFLTHNSSWKVIGGLNFLHHHHYAQLKRIAPFLTPERKPGSFYIQKVGAN